MTTTDKTKREPRPFRSRAIDGELLAIVPSALDAVYMVENEMDRPTEVVDGGIAVVCIEGPLEHHAGWFFDSYDAIVKRIENALKDENVKAVVMEIDSPGGDASGNAEASKKIRRMSAQYGKPVYAYSNESCYSAAYGLACGAEEIWLPKTGGVGSVGVIATTSDRTKANEKSGNIIELITSGKRKADGHPDRPMTDEIRATIQGRVDDLAHQFFKLVANARHTTPEAVEALEAGVFLGKRGVAAGLADGVAGWDEFLDLLRAKLKAYALRPVVGDVLDTRQHSDAVAHQLPAFDGADPFDPHQRVVAFDHVLDAVERARAKATDARLAEVADYRHDRHLYPLDARCSVSPNCVEWRSR